MHIIESGMRLGDLISYNQNLDLNSKDYSPVNQVYRTQITEDETTVNLFKERTSKILELKVFSDLKGIESDNPNGLVQLELSKKLNLWNNRRSLGKNAFNMGVLNYITPYFTMNKIENNNKRLVPLYIGTKKGDTTQANIYAASLQLLQYQTFGIGANITGITIDIPGLKSTCNFNIGFYFGRTLIEDTFRTRIDSSHFTAASTNNVRQFGVNSFQITPEICWQVFPDKRYGICLSQRFINYKLQSDVIRQVRDSTHYTGFVKSLNGNRSKIDDYSFKRWLGASEIFAFFKPSDYNQVFFRYRFNWDLDNVKTNFHQIQLGISTYLTHTKKSKKEQSASN